LDPTDNLFTMFATVCYQALQRRVSSTEVLHTNYPAVQNQQAGAPLFIAPQICYTNEIWSNISLPGLITHVETLYGPVINEGLLQIETINYSEGAITINGPNTDQSSVPGPMTWSGLGWGEDGLQTVDVIYPNANLFAIPVGVGMAQIDPVTGNPPGVLTIYQDLYNIAGPITQIVSGAFVEAFTGMHPGTVTPAMPATLYPIMFNGTSAVALIEQYQAFNLYMSSVTQVPLVPQESPTFGSTATLSALNIDQDDISLSNVDPNAIAIPNTALSAVTFSPNGVISKVSTTATGNLEASLHSIGQFDDADEAAPRRHWRLLRKWAHLTKTVLPTIQDTNTLGRFVTNLSTGSNWGTVLLNIARRTMDPNSQFNQSVQKILDGNVNNVSVKGKEGHPPISHYFKTVMKPFAEQMFSNFKHQIAANATSKTKQMMSPDLKKNVDTMMSQACVKSNDSPPADTGNVHSSTVGNIVSWAKQPENVKNVARNFKEVYNDAHKVVNTIKSWL